MARFALWLKVLWSHRSLDAELALGIDPASDPALAMRAAQLSSPRHRRRLAEWIERLVGDSEEDRLNAPSAAVPVVRQGVAEARESLLRMADLLRNGEGLRPRGIAAAERLLTFGGSALYTDTAPGAVELQARAVVDWLGDDSSAWSSASATPDGRPRFTQTA